MAADSVLIASFGTYFDAQNPINISFNKPTAILRRSSSISACRKMVIFSRKKAFTLKKKTVKRNLRGVRYQLPENYLCAVKRKGVP